MVNMIPGLDPFFVLHLFFNADTESEIFSAVYFAGLNPYFGAEPMLLDDRLYIPAEECCPLLEKTNHPKQALEI